MEHTKHFLFYSACAVAHNESGWNDDLKTDFPAGSYVLFQDTDCLLA